MIHVMIFMSINIDTGVSGRKITFEGAAFEARADLEFQERITSNDTMHILHEIYISLTIILYVLLLIISPQRTCEARYNEEVLL